MRILNGCYPTGLSLLDNLITACGPACKFLEEWTASSSPWHHIICTLVIVYINCSSLVSVGAFLQGHVCVYLLDLFWQQEFSARYQTPYITSFFAASNCHCQSRCQGLHIMSWGLGSDWCSMFWGKLTTIIFTLKCLLSRLYEVLWSCFKTQEELEALYSFGFCWGHFKFVLFGWSWGFLVLPWPETPKDWYKYVQNLRCDNASCLWECHVQGDLFFLNLNMASIWLNQLDLNSYSGP